MKINIVFSDDQGKIENSGFDEDRLKEIAQCCLISEGYDFDCEIGVTFTDNDGIRALNREYRNIDSETDVLSFPLLDRFDCLDSGIDILLGDIVISLEKAAEQAKEYGHSFEREIAFLAVHSMMHLLGYDHMQEDERKTMREHEEAVLTKLNIVR